MEVTSILHNPNRVKTKNNSKNFEKPISRQINATYKESDDTLLFSSSQKVGKCSQCFVNRRPPTASGQNRNLDVLSHQNVASSRISNSQCLSKLVTKSALLFYSLLVFVVILPSNVNSSELTMEHRPKITVKPGELSCLSFHGNKSHTDHFKLLQRDGDNLLIGARNIVYNVSGSDLTENIDSRIVWYSKDLDSEICYDKGKTESDCQNYIRVLAKKEEGHFLVCGTNAYKPLCREYLQKENGKYSYTEMSGVGMCPYDPRHNSTYVFADGELYAGTMANFQGTINLIFRKPLKTDHNDYNQLNAPDFVHSFEYGEHVFFFFRETAVEYMNCGKRVYPRVARVCKSDKGGGMSRYRNSWATFLKTRLNCSVPGDFPFYFDEIQSSSDVISGTYGGEKHDLIYALFTTPVNSIPGSAICVFSMRAVMDAFEGSFKEQKDLNSNWLPSKSSNVPEPRPGSCVNDTRTLGEYNMMFIKNHPLMDEAIPAFYGRPLLVKASFEYRFSKLAVDPQVPLLDGTGRTVDVLFVGSDNGVIFKVINAYASISSKIVEPVIIEEIHVYSSPVSVSNLQLAKHVGGSSKLVIISDDEVKAIDLHRCDRAKSCRACVKLQDPYCAWYEGSGRCASASERLQSPVFQNVTSGFHYQCPYSGENQVYPQSTPTLTTAEIEADKQTEKEEKSCAPCICPEVTPPQSSPSPPTTMPSPTQGTVDHTVYEGPAEEAEDYIYKSDENQLSNEIPLGAAHPSIIPSPIDPSMINEIGIAYAEPGITGPVIGASSSEGPLIYSAETLAIGVTAASVAALVIGFISGFLFSRKCRGDDYNGGFSENPHLEAKLQKRENLMATADPNMYTANNKHLNNLVTNYNPKNINGKSNTNTTTDAKHIKPAKCAYI